MLLAAPALPDGLLLLPPLFSLAGAHVANPGAFSGVTT